MVDSLPLPLIQKKMQRSLTSLECLILESSWQGRRYRQMAEESGYVEEYIKQVGAKLWAELSEKTGTTVTKKNLRLVFDRFNDVVSALDVEVAQDFGLDKNPGQVSPQVSDAFRFEFPSGPLSLDSPLYIPRPPIEESACREILHPGCLLCIKAPRRFGKTSLLQRVIQCGIAQGYRACRIDLLEADDEALSSITRLLRWFCCRVAYALDLGDLGCSMNDLWDPELGSKVNSGIFLDRVLSQIQQPIMLTINALERVFFYEAIARDFLSLLRFWHERSKDGSAWQKLRLVLVYSTDSYVALNFEASPFNVGHSLRLPCFTLEQFLELGRRYRLSLMEDAEQRLFLEALYQLIAGHPYLANLSFYTLAEGQRSLPEILDTATTSDSIFRSHLQEIGAQLQKSPAVLAAWQRVLEGDGVMLSAIETMYLDSLGLIRTKQGLAYPLCDLYQNFFAAQLQDVSSDGNWPW